MYSYFTGKFLLNDLESKKNIYTLSSNVSDKMNYNQFSHSTPKQSYKYSCSSYIPPPHESNTNFIHEIDSFLQEKLPNNGNNIQKLPDNVSTAAHPNCMTYERHPTISNHDYVKTTNVDYLSDFTCNQTKKYSANTVVAQAAKAIPNDQLMSLSNIWGNDGTSEPVTIQEEQLRRQVCIFNNTPFLRYT